MTKLVKLIDNTKGGLKPPRPLGKDGGALWAEITAEYRFDGDSAGIAMLALACEALDVVQKWRADQQARRAARDQGRRYSGAREPSLEDRAAKSVLRHQDAGEARLRTGESKRPPGRDVEP